MKANKHKTWLFLRFGPQEINLGGETSSGGNCDGGDGDLRDGGGDGAVERGGGGGSFRCSGDYIFGGKN